MDSFLGALLNLKGSQKESKGGGTPNKESRGGGVVKNPGLLDGGMHDLMSFAAKVFVRFWLYHPVFGRDAGPITLLLT